MNKVKLWISILVLTTLLGWGWSAEASVFHFSGTRPPFLGVNEGKLYPCPPSPNCVLSQSTDALHQIAPLRFSPDRSDVMNKLLAVLASTPNVTIVKASDRYLYAEFESNLMGFIDDVEFYAPPGKGEIEVRSASRLGESDLGVNRQRIEWIRSMVKMP